MKKPEEAPTSQEIFQQISAAKGRDMFQLLQKSSGPLVSGKYLHWHELGKRQSPDGLSRDEWWFLLKFSRQSLRQFVPLLDKADKVSFSYVQVEPIPKRLHEIDQRAGGIIQMPDQITNRETRDQYYVSSLVEEAITSSQLEGATTTRQVAKEMLLTGRPPLDRSEQMILNNYLTMEKLSSLKDQQLTKELVFEIHRLMTDETLDDPTAAGRFRRDDEEVAVYETDQGRLLYQPPPSAALEDRIQRLCAFANETDAQPFVHPVIRSIILHFMLGYEHPFVDGNGRTARALFYWSMLRHRYWLVEFISISQILLKAPAQYGRAFLFTETDECDLTYFILYHLRVIMQALVSLHAYIVRKAEELRRLETELQGIELLNHRQRALIRHAVRHPGELYTVKEHQRSHKVSYETARSDLLDLTERDLFVKQRAGKKWRFIAQPQLMGRLAAIGVQGTGTLT